MSESADTTGGTTRPNERLWILALLIGFPSSGFVQKYAGLAGVAGYLLFVAVAVWLVARYWNVFAPWLEKHFLALSVLAVISLSAGFVLLHPIEDNRGPGKSSDRNEGLELAVTRMADGDNPYYPPRVFPGPLSVLPGSILLSAPFVALGNSGYQNIFWLAAFLLVVAKWFKDRALALVLLVVPLGLSLAAQYEFVSGGDLISNGIFVALSALLALQAWSNPKARTWSKWGTCILLGVCLASRANFILLAPLFGAAVWRIAGFRQAIIASGFVALSLAAIILPFWLRDPSAFTPLMSKRKLAIVNDVLPWADMAMIGFTALVALIGALFLLNRESKQPVVSFFRWCTFVTLTPMVCAVIFSSSVHGTLDLGFMHDRFGLMYVFFALLGWGGSWLPRYTSPTIISEP